MAIVVGRAVRSRQRPLRRDAEVPFGATVLRLSAEASAGIVSAARRRPGSHNARRRFLEQLVVRRLADEYLRTLSIHGVTPRARTGPRAWTTSIPTARDRPGPRPGDPGRPHPAGDGPRRRPRRHGHSRRSAGKRPPGRGCPGVGVGRGAPGRRRRRGKWLRPGRVLPAGPPPARGGRGARPDVAPPERRGAAPRPVRVPAPPGPGGQGRAQPRGAAPAPAPPQRDAGRDPLDGGRPGPDRRGPRPARPPPAPRRGRGRGRARRAPYLRPHRRRRGPGPVAHAAALGGAPLTVGVDHHGRRHRPGHRALGPRQLGRGHRPSAGPAPAPVWSS